MKPRWYQPEAAHALFESIEQDREQHPIAVVPTAGGKTFIMCLFIDEYLSKYPESNILVLSHVDTILKQDKAAIESYFDIEVGVYSSSLGERTIKKITIGGIQSVYRAPDKFAQFDIVIIDECHLIPIEGMGMYRSFLSKIKATYVGLTATPYRLGHGYIHEGEGALFTKIVYDLGSRDNFNRLTDEGFLCRLVTKHTKLQLNTEGIKIKAGDFSEKEMSIAFDRDHITEKAIDEVIKHGAGFKKWLLFAIDISHAENIARMLRSKGIKAIAVHSQSDESREQIIADYNADKYQAIVNVNILTTGFNCPRIDLIAMLRPTQSPVLHVQTIGRGLRVHPDKQACLVLDFAGNTERLGPINDIKVRKKGEKAGTGEPVTKRCPECDCICHPTAKFCENCDHEFIFKTKLQASASTTQVVAKDPISLKKWVEVQDVSYSIHQKQGSPSSLRVTYRCGLTSFSEWICLDHNGFPKRKADHWMKMRWKGDKADRPETVVDAYKKNSMIKKPFALYIDTSQQYPAILESRFEQ